MMMMTTITPRCVHASRGETTRPAAHLLRVVVRQAGEQSELERVALGALVEVLDLADEHVAHRRQRRRLARLDHVLRLALAVDVQLHADNTYRRWHNVTYSFIR